MRQRASRKPTAWLARGVSTVWNATMRLCRKPALLALLLVAVNGCGGETEIVPFEGRVLYKGEPLQFGSVMFQPVSGGQAATGTIQPDGTFAMRTRGFGDGATVGLNRVRVTCFPAQKPGSAENTSQELALGKSLIPTHYNSFGSSGLTVEVKPEGNDPYVIDLQDE